MSSASGRVLSATSHAFRSLTPQAMFDAMTALSTNFNDNPPKASRAFDQSRDGFVIGAGGGVVVVEELEHAKARGAKICNAPPVPPGSNSRAGFIRAQEAAPGEVPSAVNLPNAPCLYGFTHCPDTDGELVGYGATADGYDMVAPSGKGGERAMELAMNMANEIGGEKPIEYVNTHGTSTPVGTRLEAPNPSYRARGSMATQRAMLRCRCRCRLWLLLRWRSPRPLTRMRIDRLPWPGRRCDGAQGHQGPL
jgi:hypothetical protein